MNKLFQFSLAIALLFSLTNQGISQTSFGVKAGANFANQFQEDASGTFSEDFETLTSFHVGLTADLPIAAGLSIEPGLFYSNKGFKLSGDSEVPFLGSFDGTFKQQLQYLEIPVMVKFTIEAGSVSLFAGVGPYAGFGFSGKSTFEGTIAGQPIENEEDIEWGSDEDEDDLRPFDYGVNGMLGIGLGDFTLSGTYSFGLANIAADQRNETNINNRVVMVSLGYYFSPGS